MKEFTIKAFVRDVKTKKESIVTIDIEAKSVTSAIKQARNDIHCNGFKIIGNHIKEASVYDFIMNKTSCDELMWTHINRVFESGDDALNYVWNKVMSKVMSY